MERLDDKDKELYEEAEARVGFKSHARTYLFINLLIWALWFYFRGRHGNDDGYWPIYMTLGWGFGLYSHYRNVYGNSKSAIDKEYQKLKREREQV